jgi:hypothetical protein
MKVPLLILVIFVVSSIESVSGISCWKCSGTNDVCKSPEDDGQLTDCKDADSCYEIHTSEYSYYLKPQISRQIIVCRSHHNPNASLVSITRALLDYQKPLFSRLVIVHKPKHQYGNLTNFDPVSS